jgi:hypothetical protein
MLAEDESPATAVVSGTSRPRDSKRLLTEDRLWRRQMLRRGLIAALVVTVTTLLFIVALPIGNHLGTAWWLERLGCRIDWQIDETNWWQGGATSVSCSRVYVGAIYGADVGDRDLHYLLNLRPVQSLNLAECHEITDKGLAILGGLQHLTALDLTRLNRYRSDLNVFNSVPLTDACLVHLLSLPRLKELALSGNRITDRGMAQIAQLRHLSELDLVATRVSDAGLIHLRGMTSLQVVNLGATRVTAEGVARLREARPDLKISMETSREIEEAVKERRGEIR